MVMVRGFYFTCPLTIAELMGPPAAVSGSISMQRLESGKRYVGMEVIWKLAEALEVEPAELLRLPPKKGGARQRKEP
jgi:hypothetical protein